MSTKNKSNELTITRLYDAPVDIVWDAWTDPEQVAQWWGPRGFSLTTHSKDLRPGGTWVYTMHGPDGTDYPNKTVYLEVEQNSRLVYDHGGNDDRPPLFRVTAVFAKHGKGTKMDMTMTLPTQEAAEETRKFIKKAGGDATWDRLAEYLEKNASGREHFVINRTFESPIKSMYELWTNPKHLAQWTPPVGFSLTFLEADIRPGGRSISMMTGSGGIKMYGRADYQSLERPHRIVYTQQFCDEKGEASRHPMSPTWPMTMLTVVTLTEEGPDRTRATVTWEPQGSVSPEELETFVNGRAGMTQGWTGSLDKLEAYIAERPAN